MSLPSFYCSTLEKQIAYGDDAYYYIEDDNTLTCVPYHSQDGILWEKWFTYNPTLKTPECEQAFLQLVTLSTNN